MLIATRFGIGIRDPAWFDHRLAVMSAITMPSLMAQNDQEFEWAIFVHPDLPDHVGRTLEGIIAPFDGRAFIDSNGHSQTNLLAIASARDLVDSSGYVLTGRIDDDDAWVRDTVGEVRTRTANWLRQNTSKPGFGMTFENGLVWVMYDMLDVARVQMKGDDAIRKPSLRPYACAFTSISGFVCSPLSHGITPIAGSHSAVPKHLAAAGFEIEVISTTEPMWLYCRHKQADSALERVVKGEKLEIAISNLSQTFGIDEKRTTSYIAKAADYGYSTTKLIFERRGELRTAFREADKKIADLEVGTPERANLEQRASQLKREHAQLGENLIAVPGEQVASVTIRHVVQTRFSVRASRGFQEFPPAWLEARLELFDSYCMPSVAAQTCEDFLWHVYCDEKTDEAIMRQLRERAEQLPQMCIILTGPGSHCPSSHVVNEARLGDQALVTTRLDSDDAISKHYIEAIQRHANEFVRSDKDTLLLNFPRGYQLDTSTGRLLFDWMPRSSFHTLFERVSPDAKTVLSGNHSTFHDEHPTEQDDSIPAWLMVIHSGNVINSVREYYTGEAGLERLKDFNLDSERYSTGVT
jgi:Putative rhamnosyl transferase